MPPRATNRNVFFKRAKGVLIVHDFIGRGIEFLQITTSFSNMARITVKSLN
jgi:hypothetical protein